MMSSKPKIRFYTNKPYRVDNRTAITAGYQIYCNNGWRVIYKYTTGRYAGLYCFKNGKDKEIIFRTLYELKDIT